jgi:hypothetical protein
MLLAMDLCMRFWLLALVWRILCQDGIIYILLSTEYQNTSVYSEQEVGDADKLPRLRLH